ncbi:hypothetical protein P4T23_06390 [Bacillus spizizenii]|uniref:hypothetical protein n=1 Tax=Bacillus TaxID=1386 RepID=UPI0021E10B1F|nr:MULTISPECIES: hypothetical protein [Bacillus]MCV0023404.1 hypothetical protein [Bacillus sp. XT-2]MCV0025691.1 hypothetical protein [Bacillus sp. XT-2]MEC1406893.1 hypothetical protein [Bacillus halotolerans]MED0868673.1 hypothetical protein [Bacillus spizizenii]WGE37080.1 hypothetical protein QA442_11365 [Bacillus stercoris]
MTEEQLDLLVNDLKNDKGELRNYITEALPEETEEQIELLVEDLDGNPMEIKEFILNTLEG